MCSCRQASRAGQAADGRARCSAASQILRRAAELRAALLAIAPHDRTATERVLHGSVTDVLVRWAGGVGWMMEGLLCGAGQWAERARWGSQRSVTVGAL